MSQLPEWIGNRYLLIFPNRGRISLEMISQNTVVLFCPVLELERFIRPIKSKAMQFVQLGQRLIT